MIAAAVVGGASLAGGKGTALGALLGTIVIALIENGILILRLAQEYRLIIIGLVIVALSMFSSVLDNLREFGTLKAIGCKNSDLSALLLVQSTLYALIGSVVGLGLVVRVVEKIRQPLIVPLIPKELFAIVPVVMLTLCLFASTLALLRIRKLEPGMVFR